MSLDVQGGLRYALLKRHYDADDYTSLRLPEIPPDYWLNGIPFTATPTFYISGLMAWLSDPTVADPERGWCFFTHGQVSAPVWLAPILVAAGIDWLNLVPGHPGEVPAFEAKDILFYADQDCWVRFEGASRVQHFIPKNTYMRFHRRCFMFWVVRDTVSGTLRCWLFG